MSTTTGNTGTPADPSVGLTIAGQPDAAAAPRALVAVDSPAMKRAIALCNEIFPGAPVDVEVMSDPDEPDRSWYCLNVDWPGEVRDCVDRSSRWYDRFDAEYRELVPDFTISVTPV
jgi:hypothetical protein